MIVDHDVIVMDHIINSDVGERFVIQDRIDERLFVIIIFADECDEIFLVQIFIQYD